MLVNNAGANYISDRLTDEGIPLLTQVPGHQICFRSPSLCAQDPYLSAASMLWAKLFQEHHTADLSNSSLMLTRVQVAKLGSDSCSAGQVQAEHAP